MALRFPVSSVLLVFVFLFHICSTGDALSKVICQGDPCTINGSPGRGTYMRQCKSALNAFRRGSPPLVVGYYFFEPIVCCPLNESSPTTTTETTPQPSSAATTTETTPPPSSTTTTAPIESPEAIAEKECNRYNRPSGMYKVIHGEPAEKNQYPHMAAIYVNNAFRCGGSLISEKYVLTAAHCFKKKETIDQIHVILGVLNLTTVENDINARHQIIHKTEHPGYNKSNTPAGYDIALLELKTNVTFNASVFPACLAYSAAFENYSIDAEVSGWGVTEKTGKISDVLLGANVPLVPMDECQKFKPSAIPNIHLCAGGKGNDTCYGDSGGPLSVYRDKQRKHFIIGITSYGAICTDPTKRMYPGVYTNVFFYIDWIQDIVWPN
ncbi:trypsin-7 [Megachile rotundata]|uniref:trypsin-7 n=1 Tax=Megachile rotundata TaxID=143995 RepID=UPI003FD32C49